ncbi:MAG: hypothetical protein AAF681_07870 [Pseudomonadota bacterium]
MKGLGLRSIRCAALAGWWTSAASGRFRERGLVRYLFEKGLRRCRDRDLVGGQNSGVDTGLNVADIQDQNSGNPGDRAARERDPADAPATRAYLDTPGDEAFGAAPAAKPKFTAHADPARQSTAARNAAPLERHCLSPVVRKT